MYGFGVLSFLLSRLYDCCFSNNKNSRQTAPDWRGSSWWLLLLFYSSSTYGAQFWLATFFSSPSPFFWWDLVGLLVAGWLGKGLANRISCVGRKECQSVIMRWTCVCDCVRYPGKERERELMSDRQTIWMREELSRKETKKESEYNLSRKNIASNSNFRLPTVLGNRPG